MSSASPTTSAPSPGAATARAAHLGPERRRPMVLDAAFELFLEHGYDGTSMEAVARATGVSKPVVYACYPSKDELFKALLRREEERVLGEIAAREQHFTDRLFMISGVSGGSLGAMTFRSLVEAKRRGGAAACATATTAKPRRAARRLRRPAARAWPTC